MNTKESYGSIVTWLRHCLFLLTIFAAALAASAGEPSLSKAEVIRLAEEGAKKEGYDLKLFKAPQVHYEFVRPDESWVVFYDEKPDKDGYVRIGGHFSVHIHDKTRKVRLHPGQ